MPDPLLYSIELMVPLVILPASRLAMTELVIGEETHDEPFHAHWPIMLPLRYCHQMSPVFVPEPEGVLDE